MRDSGSSLGRELEELGTSSRIPDSSSTRTIRFERVGWPPRPHAGQVGRPGWWTATVASGGRSAWVQAKTREGARLVMMALLREEGARLRSRLPHPWIAGPGCRICGWEHVPNAETRAAMRELDHGGGVRFSDMASLFADLNA